MRVINSTFYNGFTAIRPNLFGVRDELIHSARRRAVANRFSLQSIAGMEIYMDQSLAKLIARLDKAALSGNDVLDLRQWISFYVLDVLGELAFSRSFNTLDSGDSSEVPPLEKHARLSVLTGQVPWFQPYAVKLFRKIPLELVRKMAQGRAKLIRLAVDSVNYRVAHPSNRKDLLGKLLEELEAGKDSKGQHFDLLDVQTEAFGFIIAGSSTTGSTLTLLLWHILRSDRVQGLLRQEIDGTKRLDSSAMVYDYRSVSGLRYLSACISEGLRINPTFTLPFMRIAPAQGCTVSGSYIPGGTDLSVCNFVLHHDPEIFGPDLDEFRPERWLEPSYNKQGELLAFGTGHRACIGRNIAHVEIYKLLAALLARYEFDLVTTEEDKRRKMPITTSKTGATEIVGPLNVRVRLRKSVVNSSVGAVSGD